MLIGSVADDITGATDLSLMLSRSGLRTVQVIGLPDGPLPQADAVVIALKSRTIPAAKAVDMSVTAAKALLAAGSRQILFKYCSTFDSTDAGNIGPVTEALMTLTNSRVTIACPAFPANGRTVYQGHLFVGAQLLSDSPMRDHPLTPMRDANLVRVLQRQTSLPVGLITSATIAQGTTAVRAALAAQPDAIRIFVTDTLTDTDLMTLGKACADLPLVTGGSGIALGLAANSTTSRPQAPQRMAPQRMTAPRGRSAILAGSCSQATRGQIAAARSAGLPCLALDAMALADHRQTAPEIADWVARQTATPVVYSSADPDALSAIQHHIGTAASGTLVEQTLAKVACLLQSRGFTRFIIAGGETSGAVVAALGVKMLEIGPEIAPGVPWTRSVNGPDLALALKSGNFGAEDFFTKAWTLLDD